MKISVVPLVTLLNPVAVGGFLFGVPAATLLRRSLTLTAGNEQDDFLERMAELEDAGGDPFFLQDESPVGANIPGIDEEKDERIAEIEEMGGDPFFLSDEEDDIVDNSEQVESEDALSVESIMTMMSMSAGAENIIDKIETRKQDDAASDIDPPTAASAESTDEERLDVEAIGGDPFFVSEDRPEDTTPSVSFGDRINEVEAMGGDSFFLTDDDYSTGTNSLDTDEKEGDETPELTPEAFLAMAYSSKSSAANDTAEAQDDGEKEIPELTPEAFMAMAYSPAGSTRGDEETPSMDATSSGESHRISEIESLGGDPFFLDDETEEASSAAAIDPVEEVEAMGGDAFFLSEDSSAEPDIDEEDVVLSAELVKMAMGSGGMLSEISQTTKESVLAESGTEEDKDGDDWKWDGVVDEEAHMGF